MVFQQIGPMGILIAIIVAQSFLAHRVVATV